MIKTEVMRLKIQFRKINNTIILKLEGELIGSNVNELSNYISNFTGKEVEKIILDFKDVIAMDDLAIKTIEAMLSDKKIYIFNLRYSLRDYLSKRAQIGQWPIYSYQEIIKQLDNKGIDILLKDERCFMRVYSYVPLEIKLSNEKYGDIDFKGVAVNLGCDGVYVEYLDCEQTVDIEKWDFIGSKVDEIRILLSDRPTPVRLKGNVVHSQIINGQIGLGIKFKKINKKNKQRLEKHISSVMHQSEAKYYEASV